MRPHRKRLLDNLTTPIAFLRAVAGVHSNDLMPSTLSLGREDIEERTPGGVHDAFCEMVVFHHAIDVQLLDGNMVILFCVVFGDLEMEITALPLDLQMGLCGAPGGFPPSLATLLPSRYRALLTSKRGLPLAKVSWVLNHVPFAIGQEGLQPNINADIRMSTDRRCMFILWFGFADDEGIPMTVSTQDEMSRLGSSFYWAMQLDLDQATQLLGERQMFPVRGKREIGLVLSQLNRMPTIGLLETWETALLTKFSHRKEAFESLIQTICQHLDRGSGYMLTPTATECCSQIVFHEEFARLLIVRFGGGQHLIVEMPRLDQAPHEGFGLDFIRIDSVLKRSHGRHFTANELS